MPNIKANGIQIEYEEFGNPNDPPIILIMGLGGQMIFWDVELCQQLVDKGFRVIRFDNRDVGLSTNFNGAKNPNFIIFSLLQLIGITLKTPYTLKDMADDTAGLMDALAIKQAHIVGASLGGMIAQSLCINHPERVLSATLIFTSSLNRKLPRPSNKIMKIISTPVKDPHDLEEAIKRARNLFSLISGPNYPPDLDHIEKIVRESSKRENADKDNAPRQLLGIAATNSLVPDLQKLDLPVQIIHGDADPLVSIEAGKEIHKNIRNSKLKIYEGMGHQFPKDLYPEWADLIAAIAGVEGKEDIESEGKRAQI